MTEFRQVHRGAGVPANDNGHRREPLRAVVDIPVHLPIQIVEVEVFAELLDALLAANDDEGPR